LAQSLTVLSLVVEDPAIDPIKYRVPSLALTGKVHPIQSGVLVLYNFDLNK